MWLYFIGDLFRINIITNFGKTSFIAQKRPYLHKKTSRLMAQAHSTLSYFWLMIQVYESHQGNFGSRGLEDQEVCSVKLQ